MSNKNEEALKEIKGYLIGCEYGLNIAKLINFIDQALQEPEEKTFTFEEVREIIFKNMSDDGGLPVRTDVCSWKTGIEDCPKHRDCRECLLAEFERRSNDR